MCYCIQPLELRLWSWVAWVQIQAIPLGGYVALAKLFSLLPQFPHLYYEANDSVHIMVSLWGIKKLIFIKCLEYYLAHRISIGTKLKKCACVCAQKCVYIYICLCVQYYTAYIYHKLFKQYTIVGCLGCYRFFTMMNSTIVNTCSSDFLSICTIFSLG